KTVAAGVRDEEAAYPPAPRRGGPAHHQQQRAVGLVTGSLENLPPTPTPVRFRDSLLSEEGRDLGAAREERRLLRDKRGCASSGGRHGARDPARAADRRGCLIHAAPGRWARAAATQAEPRTKGMMHPNLPSHLDLRQPHPMFTEIDRDIWFAD